MAMENLEQMFDKLELDDVKCHVCFHVNHDPMIFLQCQHRMCAGCTGRWLTVMNGCPMCRAPVLDVVVDEEMKIKATEYLKRHPEQDLPTDIKYEQNVYEMIFWSIQTRKKADDPEIVFYGPKPVINNDHQNEQERAMTIEGIRLYNIRERLERLKERVGAQAPLIQLQYNEQMFNRLFYHNDAYYRDEDQEWQMIHGRGLVRVPRSTNRNYCPLRFRRSHST
uniref:RING-type domain-containing protein n=1 Tax=Caenorhabditis tropicalis TaxID=1561998 RepID=A0A1I7UQ88_9PELO